MRSLIQIPKIKLRLGLKGNPLGNTAWGNVLRPQRSVKSAFTKGNKLASKENLSPDAHARRMAGLFKTWETQERQHRGEKVVTRKVKDERQKRKRLKLHATVAKEFREIQEIARTHATAAMRRLAEIIESPVSQDTSAIAAAAVILDRAYGKATQTSINASIDASGKTTDVTAKELDTRIEKALHRVEAITGRAPKAAESEEQPPDVRKRDRDTGGSSVH